ncbi:MAG: hypothetical protein JWQ76_693 [Ramlibacter sp.]|nr:hypothetical protein [Ramlibacter sp.]
MNCKMPELAAAFEAAGFTEVRTLLSSGNVVFNATGTERTIRKKAEAAMQQHLDKVFMTFVRPVEELQALLEADPFAKFKLEPGAKRVITFLPAAPATVPKLPVELDGARILAVEGREVFSAYVPGAKGPVFMTLIEKTFGKDVTTRTWDTVRKAAGPPLTPA